MKGLLIAIQFMTRLPTPRVTVTDAEFAGSMRWFPAVGVIIGAIVAGAVWLGLYIDPAVAGVAGVIAWVWVTGELHLDGLADIADAAGAAHKGRERIISVLADPHIGSFGTVAIVLQLLAKLVLLAILARATLTVPYLWGAIIAIPAVARMAPLFWTRCLPPLHQGLGAKFSGAVRNIDIAIWCILLGIVASAYLPLLTIFAVMLVWGSWLKSRIGGISGDGHGAGIEIAESILLLAMLAGAQWA